MKKGISVLLIAAALFGFYGGAVSLNDVLACKDYYTGGSSGDSLQQLEDGLNQLKENEQAYLDGQVALAEGEETLAEGEQTLAEGYASYAAAPAQLAAGEKSLKNLRTLINGLKTVKKHYTYSGNDYTNYWYRAYSINKKIDGEDVLGLKPGREKIVNTLTAQSSLVDMLKSFVDEDRDIVKNASDAKTYKKFDKVVTDQLEPTFSKAASALTSFASLATDKADTLDSAVSAYNGFTDSSTGLETNWSTVVGALNKYMNAGIGTDMTAKNEETAVDFIGKYKEVISANDSLKSLAGYAALKPAFSDMRDSDYYYTHASASTLLLRGVGQQMTKFLSSNQGEMLQGIAAKADGSGGLADKVAALVQGMTALSQITGSGSTDGGTFAYVAPQVVDGLNEAATLLKQYAATAQASADSFAAWHTGYNKIVKAQKRLAMGDNDGEPNKADDSGLRFACYSMVNTSAISSVMKSMDPSLYKTLKNYTGKRLRTEDVGDFASDLKKFGKSGGYIDRALKVLNKVYADGRKTLAEGYASYAAAPAQLAEGEQALADGKAQLEAGREQLAAYEDGEQQVRDGLATLVGTDMGGGVTSIVDRIGGDTDFDNGDNHLELDEGLAAVEAGKGYVSDVTAAVTSEIMGRAVGTGALLAAGVLAILAALLSFLKKYKGAGICAILAACAGLFGAFYGNSAGSVFSEAAGSTVGTTAWVAAGILGAVAVVHAIVHFTAKKEAAK